MIIIGEKINGSIPAVKEAIDKRDAAFIADRAVKQAAAGADFSAHSSAACSAY